MWYVNVTEHYSPIKGNEEFIHIQYG
jgi:hypothetical protein